MTTTSRWASYRKEYRSQAMTWDLRHRNSSLTIRSLLALWIVVLVVVLCATGRWWGLVFVIPLAVDLYLLRRILAANSDR
jgi:polyferredoxin